MKTIIRSLATLLLAGIAHTATSQDFIMEKDYEISRKAKKAISAT